MKRFFVVSVLPYAVPAGEQGVGAERAERNLKIELGDRKYAANQIELKSTNLTKRF